MKKILRILVLICIFTVSDVLAYSSSIELICPDSLNSNTNFSCNIKGNSTDGAIEGIEATMALSDGITCTSFSSGKFTTAISATKIMAYLQNEPMASGNVIGTLNCNIGNVSVDQSISFSNIKVPVEVSGNTERTTPPNVSKTIHIKSADNTLMSLSVSNSTIMPSFSSNVTEYNTTTDSATVVISATVNNQHATVTGTGSKNLNYGNNSFNITVTSETGVNKIYKVNIYRNDTRSSENRLNNISVSTGSINFNKDTTEYNLKIDQGDFSLNAELLDNKSILAYSPSNTITLGYNETKTISITVTAENGSKKTYKVNVYRNDTRSSENRLSNISVSTGNIDFNKDTTEYNLKIDQGDFNLTAGVLDSKGSFVYSPSNKITLGYGETKTINIIVTAENGSKKTYKVNVYRNDTRSINNLLKSLTVNEYPFDFDPQIEKYTINIKSNKSNVIISAIAEDNKSIITGIGNFLINKNTIKTITVTAENGSKKNYEIKFIIREESIYLSSIGILNSNFEFDKNINYYNIGVPNSNTINDIKFEAEDANAIAKMIEGKELKIGNNLLNIEVVAESGDKNNYYLNINKEPEKINVIDDINNYGSELYFRNKENLFINSQQLSNIKSKASKLTVDIVNDNNGLIYSLASNVNELNDLNDIEYDLTIAANDSEFNKILNGQNIKYLLLSNKTLLNCFDKLTLNIYNKFDSKKLYLYSYNKNKSLELLNELNIEDGYVYINLKDSSEYIISDNIIDIEKCDFPTIELKNNSNTIYIMLMIFGSISIITLIIITMVKKFKKSTL